MISKCFTIKKYYSIGYRSTNNLSIPIDRTLIRIMDGFSHTVMFFPVVVKNLIFVSIELDSSQNHKVIFYIGNDLLGTI